MVAKFPQLPVAVPPGYDEDFPLDPIILLLKEYLNATSQPDALEKAVQLALKTGVPQLKEWGITSADGFLRFANRFLRWIPHENFEGKDIYWMICMFYFILDQPPLIQQQTEITTTSIRKPLTWLSAWIVCYAQRIGAFMDTPDSINATSFQSFVNSPKFKIAECVIPPGGFKTFNELFARHLIAGTRPLAGPNDNNVIVFPADSTFDGAWDIQANSHVNIKNIEWPIEALLEDSSYRDEFKNGIWTHSFLNTFDYHRQHAPVKGKVVEAKVIQGAAYLEVKVTNDEDGVDAPDSPGYQFLQMRGLIMIENDKLGLVAVLPIGMAHVSSVKLSISKGQYVEKGQEISYFQFGGSDCIVMFQEKAGLKVHDFPKVDPKHPKHSLMGEELVKAKPKEH
ncbi:phosphatidylserine decarboxylase-domain-containing protein [Xylogone sp. PMI_703]|nr:phosphatidylserine decarboxylase-domain-containing protein [Xylogone sp. PMI_703]